VLPGTGLVGIATSKKLGGKPQRNHVKRQIREIIRPFVGTSNPEWDFIVLVSERASNASFAEIEADIRQLFETSPWTPVEKSESS